LKIRGLCAGKGEREKEYWLDSNSFPLRRSMTLFRHAGKRGMEKEMQNTFEGERGGYPLKTSCFGFTFDREGLTGKKREKREEKKERRCEGSSEEKRGGKETKKRPHLPLLLFCYPKNRR